MVRKITFWATLLLIFTIPFEDSLAVGTNQSITRFLGLGVAGLWGLTILVEGRFRKFDFFHFLVLLFFAWSILSYYWTVNLEWTYARVKTYGQVFILVLIVWEMLQTPRELIWGMQAIIFGGYVLIASLLNNYIHGTVAVSYEVRFSASGVNAVDLALFLLMGLPIAWYLFRNDLGQYRIIRLLNLAYIPLSVFSVFLTASRTSLFAILPAVIFIAWPKRFDAKRIIMIIGLGLLSLVLLDLLLPAAVIQRLSSAGSSISGADIGGRITLWLGSIAVFLQHPLLGSGSNTLYNLIGSYAHETFLSVLAETGLIGFVIFMSVIVYIFMEIMRLPKGYKGLWVATFFVWVIGVLSLSFEFRKITWLFFSLMISQGCILRSQWQAKKNDLKFSEHKDAPTLSNPAEPLV
jgi:O-antigen ligase